MNPDPVGRHLKVVANRGECPPASNTFRYGRALMTSRRPELVSKATRRALRGLATEMYVKAIEELWQDQGFVPVRELHYEDSSVRRTRFESYAASVD